MNFHKSREAPSGEPLLPTSVQEKAVYENRPTHSKVQSQQPPSPAKKMASPRRFLLAFSLCFLVFLGLASAGSLHAWQRPGCHDGRVEGQVEAEGETIDAARESFFKSMLHGASAKSLHELLAKHFPGRFHEGVWASEHEALEAVHREDPSLATSILQLAKRETNSTVTVSSTPKPTTTVPDETTTTPSPSASASATPSDDVPSSSPKPTNTPESSTPSPSPSPPASTPKPTETSTPRPSTPRPGTSTREIVLSLNSSPLSVTPSSTSSPRASSVRVQTVATSTTESESSPSADGGTTLTTSTKTEDDEDDEEPEETPAPTSVESTVERVFTSTSNGVDIIVTETAIVWVDPTKPPAPATTRATPELHQGSGASHHVSQGALFVAVMVAALVMA